MRVLGIDPGLATLGYGVVEGQSGRFSAVAFGVITTPAKQPLPVRLEQLYISVQDMIIKFSPQAVSIEELFFSRNTTSAMAVAQARGVALLAAQQSKLPLFEYTPMQVKQAVSGYGHAEKDQVQWMVQRMLGLKEIPKPDDAADGLALAICLLQSSAFHQQFAIR